jgi:LmbE family N-acetylglucosaminyl deacetylase
MQPVPDGARTCTAMATLVFLHAHPDDEAIMTAGSMARAADDGHRVVVVFATRGELGETPPGLLVEGETLAERRTDEARRAGELLGAARVEFLPYLDSGMAGSDTVDAPGAFAAAAVDEAAAHLAALLREEHTDVLTLYDERGGYEHPDHVQVHRVGLRAAELAGTPRVYAATVDADAFRELAMAQRAAAEEAGAADDAAAVPDPDEINLGIPGARITTRVDVTPYLARKRAAMALHESQISEEAFFLAMPDDMFASTFSIEWYERLDSRPAAPETWLLD